MTLAGRGGICGSYVGYVPGRNGRCGAQGCGSVIGVALDLSLQVCPKK